MDSLLIEKLTKETQDLKKNYIEQTEKWAESQFDQVVKRVDWSEAEWCKFLGIGPELRKLNSHVNMPGDVETLRFPSGFYNTRNSKTYRNALDFARGLKYNGKENFISKMVKAAEQHYTGSIIKLATRITLKGLKVSKMEIQSSRVGVNLEMVLSDGVKTVKAWTIVAEGEIQKPHYRYLVK